MACRKIELFGQTSFETLAYLTEEIRALSPPRKNVMYGNADGMGTAYFQNESSYRAISEALERWAIYNWWSGKLDFLNVSRICTDIDVYVIATGFKKVSCVILRSATKYGNTFGFAAGACFDDALKKAKIELDRNCRVLANFFNISELKNIQPAAINEKRLLFFASKNGAMIFDERVHNTMITDGGAIAVPQLVVDEELVGPWSRFCTVWRCLFPVDLDSKEYDPDVNWFSF